MAKWNPHAWTALVLALAAHPSQGREEPRVRASQEALGQALSLLRKADAGADQRCRRQLLELADSAAPALVAALLDPASLSDELGPLVDRQARGLLIEALRALPAGELDPILTASLRAESRPVEKLQSIELLGELGGLRSIEPLLGLLTGLDPVLRQNATVTVRLEQALAGLLGRHEPAYQMLAASAEALDLDLQCLLARAVGKAGGGQGLAVLQRLLGRAPELDRAVLEAVGGLDRSDPASLLGECSVLVSWYLNSSDSELQRLAILALGRHGGAVDCARLIPLLAAEAPETRRAAHWALGSISGASWAPDEATWSRWFAGELDWYRARSPQLVSATRGRDAALAFAALGELSSHPLFHRELAADLEPALLEAETPIAATVCTALARLGGPAGTALLTRASGDRRPPVAEAAVRALSAPSRP